jgi:hypothetical protein
LILFRTPAARQRRWKGHRNALLSRKENLTHIARGTVEAVAPAKQIVIAERRSQTGKAVAPRGIARAPA